MINVDRHRNDLLLHCWWFVSQHTSAKPSQLTYRCKLGNKKPSIQFDLFLPAKLTHQVFNKTVTLNHKWHTEDMKVLNTMQWTTAIFLGSLDSQEWTSSQNSLIIDTGGTWLSSNGYLSTHPLKCDASYPSSMHKL